MQLYAKQDIIVIITFLIKKTLYLICQGRKSMIHEIFYVKRNYPEEKQSHLLLIYIDRRIRLVIEINGYTDKSMEVLLVDKRFRSINGC